MVHTQADIEAAWPSMSTEANPSHKDDALQTPPCTAELIDKAVMTQNRPITHDDQPITPLAHHPRPGSSNDDLVPRAPQVQTPPRIVEVVAEFTSSRPDELSIQPGQKFHRLEEYADGWCKVRRNFEEGIVPCSCLRDYP